MHTSELLCGYPQTSISSRVFYQILVFLGEIVGYQMIMNCTLCVVTLLASSVQPQRRRKRENERKKNCQRAAHFCKVRCRHRKTDVVKLNWNDNAIVALVSKILVFINGDRRDFDFVGITHTETHIYSFLGIFTFGLCGLLQCKNLLLYVAKITCMWE